VGRLACAAPDVNRKKTSRWVNFPLAPTARHAMNDATATQTGVDEMTAATINKINAEIAKHGVEVVKGNGYFYFADTGEEFVSGKIKSVYSMNLRCMSLEDWVSYVEYELAS
jgi:hypothetical protein